MTRTFGAAAARLAGLVPRALGWRPVEFWAATPAELMAILSCEEAPNPGPLDRDELTSLLERYGDG